MTTASETTNTPEAETPPGTTPPPGTASLALTRALQLLDTMIDQQLATKEISSETLATVRPLTALLDLLARPQDQSTELGKQLAGLDRVAEVDEPLQHLAGNAEAQP